MDKTWIKLYRSILTDAIFTNPETLKVWIWILCKTYFEPKTVFVGRQQVDLQTGQMLYGRKAAAMQLHMSESKVYRIIRFLKDKGCIDVESFSKYSVITVNNWGTYQGSDNFFAQKSEQQMNTKRTSGELLVNTINNIDNIENINNFSSTSAPAGDYEANYKVLKPMGGTLGKGVLVLSEEQIDNLLDMMPINLFDYYCNKLSSWIVDKKRTVANHYNLIVKWYNEDYGNKQEVIL